jgi:hypothetical protein
VPHPRQLIRDAVIAQLTGQTAAQTRVDDSRTEPHRRGPLPAISVYTEHETVVDDSKQSRPGELLRELDVVIVGWVEHTQARPATRALDDLAAQIEIIMDADPYLGGLAGGIGVWLSETEIAIEDENELRPDPLIGVIRMTYVAPYLTSPLPPAALADYLRTHAVTQLDANNTVTDDFNQR